jgi:di/tricarboxylate transporter
MGSELNSYSIFAASAIIGFVMSYSASNTASAVIACPIAATLAIGAGLNPIPPIIALLDVLYQAQFLIPHHRWQ